MAEFDVGTLDAGGNLSEERKLTLLRRQNMTADELEAEEEDDEEVFQTFNVNDDFDQLNVEKMIYTKFAHTSYN